MVVHSGGGAAKYLGLWGQISSLIGALLHCGGVLCFWAALVQPAEQRDRAEGVGGPATDRNRMDDIPE